MMSFDVCRKDAVPTFQHKPVVAVITLAFVDVFPHLSVGVSEVRQTSDSSLYLILGVSPETISQVAGLMYRALLTKSKVMLQIE